MNINTKDLEFTTFMLNRVDDTGEYELKHVPGIHRRL